MCSFFFTGHTINASTKTVQSNFRLGPWAEVICGDNGWIKTVECCAVSQPLSQFVPVVSCGIATQKSPSTLIAFSMWTTIIKEALVKLLTGQLEL